MIVSRSDLAQVCLKLLIPGRRGLDTETTGLTQADRIFSIIIYSLEHSEAYYFNFNRNAPNPEHVLDRDTTFALLKPVFEEPKNSWDLSNAKYDLRMLRREGLEIAGNVHCTEAIERIIKNNHMQYGLAACASRRGLEKSTAVDEYIGEKKLTTSLRAPGKKKVVTLKHFDQVPFEIMHKYAEHDAYLSTTIAADQDAQIEKLNQLRAPDGRTYKTLSFIAANEKRLTKTLSRLEGRGIRFDRVRTAQALAYEEKRALDARTAWRERYGSDFVSSGKYLAPIFEAAGVAYTRTAAGNPSFTADWLDELPDHVPLGRMINAIRRPEKRAGTYYGAYLHLGVDDRIYGNIRQGGTESGRLSASDPNLTNIPKEDDEEDLDIPFHVRECFIPDEGMLFVDIDWQQIQYRLMADMAHEKRLISAIMDGQDVHDATAQLCGITRKQAKTLNFALLFGAGPAKIAGMLGVSEIEARRLRDHYFARLPKIESFIRQVSSTGKGRGWVHNPYGRRCHLHSPEAAYILPNHIIQGAEGDTLKIAMNRIDDFFASRKARSSMALPVHDQILFNFHPNELDLVAGVVNIMESVYDDFTFNGMKLLTSTEHATERWGKRYLKKGLPA